MRSVKFTIIQDPGMDYHWDYKYSSDSFVMAGNLYAKEKTEAFCKTLHMFLISLGPQNVTILFGEDDEDLLLFFDDFVNEPAKFSRERTEIYSREFQSRFVHSLFKISRR